MPAPRTYDLGEIVARIVGPLVKKSGFPLPELLVHWDAIVGKEVADYARPHKLQRAPRSTSRAKLNKDEREAPPRVLVVQCAPHAILFVQHQSDELKARINQFLGYEAVDQIKLIQR